MRPALPSQAPSLAEPKKPRAADPHEKLLTHICRMMVVIVVCMVLLVLLFAAVVGGMYWALAGDVMKIANSVALTASEGPPIAMDVAFMTSLLAAAAAKAANATNLGVPAPPALVVGRHLMDVTATEVTQIDTEVQRIIGEKVSALLESMRSQVDRFDPKAASDLMERIATADYAAMGHLAVRGLRDLEHASKFFALSTQGLALASAAMGMHLNTTQ